MSSDQPNKRMTEMPSEHVDLDKMSVDTLLRTINLEDAKVHEAVKKAIPQIEQLVNQMVPRMKNGGRLFYIGAGTSGRLGVLDASEIPPTFGFSPDRVIGLIAGGDSALRQSVEAAEDDPRQAWNDICRFAPQPNDTVIGIAASGSTPYVVGGIEVARMHGLLTGCITCNDNTLLAKAAEYPIEAVTGPELVTGSTRLKAGTAQKMILNMITTTVMVKLGRVKGNKMIHLKPTNKKLLDRGVQILTEELHITTTEAKKLLLAHRSVNEAINHYNKQRS